MLLETVIRRVHDASAPGDIFGPDPGIAKKTYRRWASVLHPDRNPGNAGAAAAFSRLHELWDRYQHPAPEVIHGDIADLFPEGENIAKFPRQHQDNDLMTREALALRELHRDAPESQRVFFPQLVSTRRQCDPATRVIRRVNVISRLEGFYSLEEVMRQYPSGLDPRDVAWMWRRLLAALGAAHRAGIVHGAVLPCHIMIHPDEHGLALLDWCYSATSD
jgi:Lipopolysaccharide kinase (Kdo/WaaP) family